MGYRSDVAYAIKFNLLTDELLKDFIQYADDIQHKIFNGEAYVLFILKSIKWYEHEEGYLANKLNKLEIPDEDYKLIVLGEERDDMREAGDLEVFSLGISRDINIDQGRPYERIVDYDNVKVDMFPNSEEAVFNKIRKIQNELHSNQD